MRKFGGKQQGMTFLGVLIVLAVIALVVFLGLRLYPVYYEKFQVLNAMKGAAAQPNAANMPKKDLRNIFLKNLTATTNIDRFNRDNISKYMQIKSAKKKEPRKIIMKYEIRGPFFDTVELAMNFNETVPVGQSRGD